MFLQNKYYRWYSNICQRGLFRSSLNGYTEKHHIIPRCMGGTNRNDNIVILTAREHYVAHLCLVFCTTGTNQAKMLHAIACFKRGRGRQREAYQHMKMNSHLFAKMRERRANALRGPNLAARHPKSVTVNMGRYERTEEIRCLISRNRQGKGNGERNAMHDVTNRQKVSNAKRGLRRYLSSTGERRMFFPNQVPSGYVLAKASR